MTSNVGTELFAGKKPEIMPTKKEKSKTKIIILGEKDTVKKENPFPTA